MTLLAALITSQDPMMDIVSQAKAIRGVNLLENTVPVGEVIALQKLLGQLADTVTDLQGEIKQLEGDKQKLREGLRRLVIAVKQV